MTCFSRTRRTFVAELAAAGIHTETAKWSRIVKESGAKAE